MYVLGIDGGGTKTVGIIAGIDGNIIDSQAVGPTNPNSIGFNQAGKEINQLLTRLQINNPKEYSKITAVFAGMSGVDREKDKIVMRHLFSRYFNSDCKISVTNDAINALYSGTLGKPGVVNICGTGSITLGIDQSGKTYRVGGWGFLLEDSASGYSIGRDALIHIFAEYDGHGKKTVLTDKVLKYFNVQLPSDLISFIYEVGKSRTAISSITIKVLEAAEEGDEIAVSILEKAGKEMAISICRLLRKLPKQMFNEIPVPTVLAGSIYHERKWFLPIMESEIQEAGFFAKLVVPEFPPVIGSIFAAYKSIGVNIDHLKVESLKKTLMAK